MATYVDPIYDEVRQRLRARDLDDDLIADIEQYRALCEKQAADNIIAFACSLEDDGSSKIGENLHGIFDGLYTGKP